MTIAYQWVIVAILWVSHTAYYLNYMTIGTLAPFMKSDFRLSSVRIGILSSAITIGSMIIQIPSGAWADRFGAKWVMVTGLLLVGLSALSIALAHSYLAIFLLLVLVGIGIGSNQTPGTKAIIMWFPLKGRATAMGIKQTGVNMGGILASFMLPLIALKCNSWRFSFAATGLAAIAAAAPIFLLYRDSEGYQATRSGPLFSRKSGFFGLLCERDFMLVCLTGVFLMATQFSFATYFMLYATTVLGLHLAEGGFMLALAFFSGAIGRIGWSVVSDYLLGGRRNTILVIIGLIGMGTSLVCVGLKAGMPSFLIYCLAVVFGFAGLGWNALYLTRVGEYPEKRLAGTATGIAFVISNAGAIIGPPVFGYLVDLTGGYSVSWLFTAFCMAMVALLTMIQKKERIAVKCDIKT
jgi:ACS family hexuronate transporter-like MFS transporter